MRYEYEIDVLNDTGSAYFPDNIRLTREAAEQTADLLVKFNDDIRKITIDKRRVESNGCRTTVETINYYTRS